MEPNKAKMYAGTPKIIGIGLLKKVVSPIGMSSDKMAKVSKKAKVQFDVGCIAVKDPVFPSAKAGDGAVKVRQAQP